MAADAGDWMGSHSYASDAVMHLGRVVERMAPWLPDVQAWITQAHGEMRALREEGAKKK